MCLRVSRPGIHPSARTRPASPSLLRLQRAAAGRPPDLVNPPARPPAPPRRGSFAAIALGAAFGDASGRGALVGILSAGMIAFITACLGGTRVQCSGPTAPMTTVTTLIVTFSRTKLFDSVKTQYNSSSPGCDQDTYDSTLCPLPDHFVNLVLIMGAIMIFLMGLCQTGVIIKKVPNVVISGFMNGIAVQIWAGQITKVMGTIQDTEPRMRGDWVLNLPFVIGTTVLCFYLGVIIKKLLPPKAAKKVPGAAPRVLVGLSVPLCILYSAHGHILAPCSVRILLL